MIKNIVFDLGRVMVDFDPVAYLRSFGYPEEDVQLLNRVIFGVDWFLHDRGDYETIGDLCEALAERHPSHADQIRAVLSAPWVEMHVLKPDSAAYMAELKQRGYHIYVLSNLSTESYAYVSGFDFFSLAEGGVFSYQERSCKPEEKIYRSLLDRYSLLPEETVFIDDNPANIEEANRLGIHGVLFTDISAAKTETEGLLASLRN